MRGDVVVWIVGLTGAIGAGKSTIACQFQSLGAPIHCADREIHRLLKEDETIKEKVRNRWPGVTVGGDINRSLLAEAVLGDPQQLRDLENILYPGLVKSQKSFLENHQKIKTPLVILDVPLLMEVGLYKYCHKAILVEAPFLIRRWRVLRRSGMPIEKLKKFESQQFPDEIRRKHADFIIATGRGKRSSLEMVKRILAILERETAPAWEGRWPRILKREPYEKRNRS